MNNFTRTALATLLGIIALVLLMAVLRIAGKMFIVLAFIGLMMYLLLRRRN